MRIDADQASCQSNPKYLQVQETFCFLSEEEETNLWQICFDTFSQSVYHGSETIEHDDIFSSLFLEGVQDAIDQLLLQAVIDLSCTLIG